MTKLYLEWTRDKYKPVGTEILKSGSINRHQVDNVTRSTTLFIGGYDEGLLVDICHDSGTETHSGFEAKLEVLSTV